MAEYRLPSLGADMEAATLVEWFVKPGDAVHRGTVVAAVETAKGIIDIEIFADGVIESLEAVPGATVPVGATLATYRPAGADRPEPAAAPSAAAGEQSRAVPEPSPAKPAAASRPAPLAASEQPSTAAGAREAEPRILASPAARRRAAELAIDIANVRPARPGGAVTLQDVERTATRAPPPAVGDMRTIIARAMSRSKREIPHYYLATPIDMTVALAFLERWNRAHAVTARLLPGVLLLKAVAQALEKAPELNGHWRDERFEPAAEINVGVAIRLRQGGLVAPALAAANKRPLDALMRDFQGLVARARAGGLRSSELAGGTITVSSLGESGVEAIYPVIYPPQVAIIGFGGIALRPWARGTEIVAAPLVTATLAADHRASDGDRGSRFLTDVARRLQCPEEL